VTQPGLLVLLLFGACARATLQGSVADDHGGAGATAEMDFWDGLASVPQVSNHDALHALLLSFGGGAEEGYEAQVAAARKRGWVAADEELPRNETARVGWIAKAVCIEAGIEGGLTMRVLGPKERYAVMELNYLGWLPDLSTRQSVSGGQLVALLCRAEDHRTGASDMPKEDL
jgi:hypothetical protein